MTALLDIRDDPFAGVLGHRRGGRPRPSLPAVVISDAHFERAFWALYDDAGLRRDPAGKAALALMAEHLNRYYHNVYDHGRIGRSVMNALGDDSYDIHIHHGARTAIEGLLASPPPSGKLETAATDIAHGVAVELACHIANGGGPPTLARVLNEGDYARLSQRPAAQRFPEFLHGENERELPRLLDWSPVMLEALRCPTLRQAQVSIASAVSAALQEATQ